MSRLVHSIDFVQDTANASQVVPLAGLIYQAGDLLVIDATHQWYGGNLQCATTGWLQAGGDFTEVLLGSAGQQAIFYKIAASGAEADPTITAGNSSVWKFVIYSVRGAHQTTPIRDFYANGWASAKPAAATITDGAISAPVSTNCPQGALCFYHTSSYISSSNYSRYGFVPKAYGKYLAHFFFSLGGNFQLDTIFYGANPLAAGSSPAFDIANSGSNSSVCTILVINDAATTEAEPYVLSGATLLRYYMHVCDNKTAGFTRVAPTTACAPVTAIDGMNLGAVAAPLALQFSTGGDLHTACVTNDSTATAGLVGYMDSYTFPDLTNKVLALKYTVVSAPDTKTGPNGLYWVFVDNVGGISAFQLRDEADLVVGTTNRILLHTSTTPTSVAGTAGADWANIRYVGLLLHRSSTDSYGMQWAQQEFMILNDWVLVGGSEGMPLSPKTIGEIYGSRTLLPKYATAQGAGQVVTPAGFQIGDGTIPTYFKLTGGSIENNDPLDPKELLTVKIPAQTQTYGIKTSAACTMDFSGGVVRFNSRQTWSINSASNTGCAHSFVATAFMGADVVWKTGFDATGATFSGCYTIDGKAQKFDTNTFKGCLLTSGAYLRLDGGGDGTPSGAINSTFTKGGETYAVELRTAGFYDFTDATFTGYTNELHISGPAGTYNIRLAVGQTQPDVYNPNSRTIVWDVPTVNVTFAPLAAGSQVVVYAQGTTTEMFRDDNSSTTEAWTAATGAYDYTIMKAGMLPVRGSGAAPTASLTIDPQQKVDRAYVASSVLAFTDIALDFTNKYLKCNLTSTVQNLYAFLIESWIAQASCKNKAFPMVPNGPGGFGLVDGWETRGFTTAGTGISNTTLDNLYRDGLAYFDTSAVLTASWAALLTSGVPAGKQARYQQSDGGATVNCRNVPGGITTGDADQLVQIYGNASHGNFDKTGYLVLKAQAAGYDQVEANVVTIYGTLDYQLYAVGLAPLPNGIATGDPALTITITDHGASPVTWNSKVFSVTITDNATPSSGTDILRELRHNFAAGGTYQGTDAFNWHDLVQVNGSKFKTARGAIYGDTGAALKGVRVLTNAGAAHPDFDTFTADDGTTYVPDVSAPITWAGALDGTTCLLYNDSDAGALIDTQAVSGAGGYDWTISLPHVDVAVGDSLRLRYGHKEYYAGELQGTMTASGLTFVGSMTLHPVYAGWALNGATYDQANGGPYVMDGTNLQVDIAAAATTGLKTQLGAWTQYLLTLPAGLDAFYGAWDLLALNQIRQNVAVVNVMIDVPTAGALFTFTDNNVNYYRSDFTFPGNVQAGHGLIAMTYNAEPFVATVAGGDVVTGTPASVAAAVRSELSAELAATLRAEKFARNKQVLDPATGARTVYDNDGTTVLGQGNAYMDVAGTQPYNGTGPVHRTERLA